MKSETVKSSDVGYDLVAPCNDCPFRKSTPFDEGVASDLTEFIPIMERGEFVFSCHKTDHRAVRPGERDARQVQGKVQHCVGTILMCEKSGMGQVAYVTAHVKKRFDIKKLRGSDEVSTFKEFIDKYYKGLRKFVVKTLTER